MVRHHPSLRRARTTFESSQTFELERYFSTTRYPSHKEYIALSRKLSKDVPQLKNWFKNQRRRLRILSNKETTNNGSSSTSPSGGMPAISLADNTGNYMPTTTTTATPLVATANQSNEYLSSGGNESIKSSYLFNSQHETCPPLPAYYAQEQNILEPTPYSTNSAAEWCISQSTINNKQYLISAINSYEPYTCYSKDYYSNNIYCSPTEKCSQTAGSTEESALADKSPLPNLTMAATPIDFLPLNVHNDYEQLMPMNDSSDFGNGTFDASVYSNESAFTDSLNYDGNPNINKYFNYLSDHTPSALQKLNDSSNDKDMRHLCRERTRFKTAQIAELEKYFSKTRYPSRKELLAISTKLYTSVPKLKNWFRNRRRQNKILPDKKTTSHKDSPTSPTRDVDKLSLADNSGSYMPTTTTIPLVHNNNHIREPFSSESKDALKSLYSFNTQHEEYSPLSKYYTQAHTILELMPLKDSKGYEELMQLNDSTFRNSPKLINENHTRQLQP